MKRLGPKTKLYPSQLKAEWKRLGRRAMRLWRLSGGVDPEIDVLFKRMDVADRTLARFERQAKVAQRRTHSSAPQ